MKINYSIIIPHKDIPDLLQRCLDSIPQRGDVQVIVVDDNSDPDKVDFAHFPGLDRPDVECYFTKEGKGAGYARNVGLKHARGKWLLFADADDFFHPNLLDILDPWKDSLRDIIYFETDSVDCDTLEPVGARLHLHPSKMIREEMENSAEWVCPVGKMVSNDLVQNNDILFDEVRWSNDVMFSAQCGYYAGKNVDICSDLLYCATLRANSLCLEMPSKEHLMCRLDVDLRYERYTHRHRLKVCVSQDGLSFIFFSVTRFKLLSRKSFYKSCVHYMIHGRFRVVLKDFIIIANYKMKHLFDKG